jgi:hypothetical protein
MEYFSKKLYDLRLECDEYIKSQMRPEGVDWCYNLVDPKAVEDMDTDVLVECPATSLVGRYDQIYQYNIYKVEITKQDELWFHGIDLEESNDYVFGVSELDSECLVDVASWFQSLNEKAK